MGNAEDWDGTPQWDQEPKVPEKYIHHVDANVESSKSYLLDTICPKLAGQA